MNSAPEKRDERLQEMANRWLDQQANGGVACQTPLCMAREPAELARQSEAQVMHRFDMQLRGRPAIIEGQCDAGTGKYQPWWITFADGEELGPSEVTEDERQEMEPLHKDTFERG
jgi:hypothetical protein